MLNQPAVYFHDADYADADHTPVPVGVLSRAGNRLVPYEIRQGECCLLPAAIRLICTRWRTGLRRISAEESRLPTLNLQGIPVSDGYCSLWRAFGLRL